MWRWEKENVEKGVRGRRGRVSLGWDWVRVGVGLRLVRGI